MLQRGRSSVNFRLVAEQSERIRQFYAANRELGRALKTEFVLLYMAEPTLRARVRRGLLKVEQLHARARAVYYGQRGRISAREVYGQMNACSCLRLILACIGRTGGIGRRPDRGHVSAGFPARLGVQRLSHHQAFAAPPVLNGPTISAVIQPP